MRSKRRWMTWVIAEAATLRQPMPWATGIARPEPALSPLPAAGARAPAPKPACPEPLPAAAG